VTWEDVRREVRLVDMIEIDEHEDEPDEREEPAPDRAGGDDDEVEAHASYAGAPTRRPRAL
jgi:hypothetical protein